MERLRRRQTPVWLVVPLMFLGLAYIVTLPLGLDDWKMYIAYLIASVGLGVYSWWRYRVFVVPAADGSTTYKIHRR